MDKCVNGEKLASENHSREYKREILLTDTWDANFQAHNQPSSSGNTPDKKNHYEEKTEEETIILSSEIDTSACDQVDGVRYVVKTATVIKAVSTDELSKNIFENQSDGHDSDIPPTDYSDISDPKDHVQKQKHQSGNALYTNSPFEERTVDDIMVDHRHDKTTSQFVSETTTVIPATPTDDFSRKMFENHLGRCDSEIPLTGSLDAINHVRKRESLSGKSSNDEPTVVEKVKKSYQVDDIRHDKTTNQNEQRTNSALVKMDTKTCDEVDGKVTSSVDQRQIAIGNEEKILRGKKDNPKIKIRKRAKKSRQGQMFDKPIRQKKKEKTLPIRPIDNVSTNKRFRKIILKRKSKESFRKRTPHADFRRTFTHGTQIKSKRNNWIKIQTIARELKKGDVRSRDIFRKFKKKKKKTHTFESVFAIARQNCFERNDCFKLLRRNELTKRRYFKMSYHILEKCGKLKTKKDEENTMCDTKNITLHDGTLNGDEVELEQRLLPFKNTSTSDDFQTNVKTRGYWLSEIQMNEHISVFAVTFDYDEEDDENLLPAPNLPGLSTIVSIDNVSVSELNVQVRTQNRDSNSGAERQHNNGTIYTRQFQTQSTSSASETVASVVEQPEHVNLDGQMIVTVTPAPNEGAPSIKETGIIAESSGYNSNTCNPVAQCYTDVHCAQQTVLQNESTGLGRGCEQYGNDDDDSSDTEDEE